MWTISNQAGKKLFYDLYKESDRDLRIVLDSRYGEIGRPCAAIGLVSVRPGPAGATLAALRQIVRDAVVQVGAEQALRDRGGGEVAMSG